MRDGSMSASPILTHLVDAAPLSLLLYDEQRLCTVTRKTQCDTTSGVERADMLSCSNLDYR